MTEARVLIETGAGIATISINRPKARNALLVGMGGEICAHLDLIASQPDIRVVILRGTGKDFCPGADMKAAPSMGDNPPPPDFDAYRAALMLHEMPQVTVAAIRGACAGAGFGYACACDFRVGDDDVRMRTAFLDVGVAGDMGVPWTLPRLVGAGRARDLMFLPRKLDSEEALELGILERVWPTQDFETELAAFAERLAQSAPLALTAMKLNFLAGEDADFRAFLAMEAEQHIRLMRSDDRAEAFTAWLEKRSPRFAGS